jgi:hypothetical protein
VIIPQIVRAAVSEFPRNNQMIRRFSLVEMLAVALATSGH